MRANDKNLAEARKLAEHMTTIPECPRSEAALDALADDLLEICADSKELRWLVHEARARWESWRGTVGLRSLIDSNRPEVAPANQFVDYQPSPVDCGACNDFGFVSDGKTSKFCECSQGDNLRERFPGFIEKLHRSKAAAKR